ncbi:hypothetical protein ACFL6F_01070 [Planctomycetota bacterium]
MGKDTMNRYAYKGVNKKGKEVIGIVMGKDEEEAIKRIKEKGYLPLVVTSLEGLISNPEKKHVKKFVEDYIREEEERKTTTKLFPVSVFSTENNHPNSAIPKNILIYILNTVFMLYFMSLMIMIPYFNWCYARDKGFVKWLFLGEIVATGKGIAWPFFVSSLNKDNSSGWTEDEIDNAKHIISSFKADIEALNLQPEGANKYILSEEEANNILKLTRIALLEAEMVKDNILRKAHPELESNFRNLYQKSLEIRILILEKPGKGFEAGIESAKLHSRWVDWYKENRNEIKIPK